MAALIQFVDSISDDPIVRLDLNDTFSWICRNFQAPPPRLRRSTSSNAMGDGDYVGSSSYENRTLTLDLYLIEDLSEDLAAIQMQALWRELDRPTNILMYFPEGLEQPVFFRTFRSDVNDLEELWTSPIARRISIEVLAEPFALGAKETLGPFTVNNDPAAGSNPFYCDVSGILGDVAAEPAIWWSTTTRGAYVTSTHSVAAIPSVYAQAESATLGTDTTNLGGGPDADMSGAGTNNFLRTSFATATMQPRVTFANFMPAGSWRVLMGVRRSSATGVINVRLKVGAGLPGESIATPLATTRRILDLGVRSSQTLSQVGPSGMSNTMSPTTLQVSAERVSGTSTIDWDFILLLPVGGQLGEVAPPQSMYAGGDTISPLFDGTRSAVLAWSGGNPTLGTSTISPSSMSIAGGFPQLHPAVVNRLHVVHEGTSQVHTKGTSVAINIAYWPRYLYVRPEDS